MNSITKAKPSAFFHSLVCLSSLSLTLDCLSLSLSLFSVWVRALVATSKWAPALPVCFEGSGARYSALARFSLSLSLSILHSHDDKHFFRRLGFLFFSCPNVRIQKKSTLVVQFKVEVNSPWYALLNRSRCFLIGVQLIYCAVHENNFISMRFTTFAQCWKDWSMTYANERWWFSEQNETISIERQSYF